MKNVIVLVLGDWSHDGHSKSSIITIRSNLTKSEIEKAYEAGSKEVGFSFTADVCSSDNNLITQEQIELLENADIDTSDILPPQAWTEGSSVDEECFFDIYMEIVELGNPELEWERIYHEENHIRIDGYGLFR